MQASTGHGVAGIVSECCGDAMCATCQVYVDASRTGQVPAVGDKENAVLDGVAAERRIDSHLSCQIEMTQEFDGLVLGLLEWQV